MQEAAGEVCAICEEKTHVPVVVRCKHVFCEECVSEWYVFLHITSCIVSHMDYIKMVPLLVIVNPL